MPLWMRCGIGAQILTNRHVSVYRLPNLVAREFSSEWVIPKGRSQMTSKPDT